MPTKKAAEIGAKSGRRRTIVVGMQRSGTSCVGDLLTRLGVYFGNSAIATGTGQENPKGFFERRDLREMYSTILQGSGCDGWALNDFSPKRVPSAARAEADEKFAQMPEDLETHRPWFIKEPPLRLTFPLVAQRGAHPAFILTWRRPLETARSLAARNGFCIDFGLAFLEVHVRMTLATSRCRPTAVVFYNGLVQTERLVQTARRRGLPGSTLPARRGEGGGRPRSAPQQNRAARACQLLTPSQQRLIEALAGSRPTAAVRCILLIIFIV